MENADAIKGKVGEYLRESLAHLPLSYELATIKLDVVLDEDIREMHPRAPDKVALKALYTEYEFRQWNEELANGVEAPEFVSSGDSEIQASREYDVVFQASEFELWLEKLSSAELITFDTETTSLDYMAAELVGVSFAVTAGEAAYVPIAHNYEGAPTQLSLETVLRGIKPILEDPSIKKIGQNMKYDMSVMGKYGVEIQGLAFDTMLESYVLNSVASRHNMDDLASKYLGRTTIHFEDIAGKGAKQLTFNQIDLEVAGEYAAEDADITLQLHQTIWPRLSESERLRTVFETIELPLVGVLSRIERNGVLLDTNLLAKQSEVLAERIDDLEKEAFALAGEEFNLGSPKQLQQIFFEKLKLPVIRKTPKGQPSTAEPVLQELAHDYPLPKVIMEYRGLTKLKSTYTDQLPKQVHESTGRVHTSYHQAVAATGRLSSKDPNLQNIPIRTEEGRRVRRAFIAAPGYKLIAADYSQIELRIMAHLSKDDGLLKAFKDGLDIHSATASEVFGHPIEQVKDFERRSAKAINFGLIYGMSAFGLARQLSIPRGDAQDYIDLYFERYPGVRAYMDRVREEAADNGYVETIFGRRLYLPDITASNFQRRQGAERAAINAPMQGSAADIIKLAMIDVDGWLTDSGIDAKMIMQVHDELVLEVKEDLVPKVMAIVDDKMSSAAELDVPLVVESGMGDNWEVAH